MAQEHGSGGPAGGPAEIGASEAEHWAAEARGAGSGARAAVRIQGRTQAPSQRDESKDRAFSTGRADALLPFLGRAWSARLLRSLASGPARFNDLKAALAGISSKTLSETLRDAAKLGLAQRVPALGAMVYRLTPKGSDLAGAVAHLDALAERWEAGGTDRTGAGRPPRQRVVTVPKPAVTSPESDD